MVALALNTADPIIAGEFGKAAFDAVGPLLLIGWAEVGPGLLAAITTATAATPRQTQDESAGEVVKDRPAPQAAPTETDSVEHLELHRPLREGLLDRARQEDLHHWREHQRPVSAETLRGRLRVGARTSRDLVAAIRSEYDIGSEQASEQQHA